MSIFISARRGQLPFVIEVTDATLDETTAAVRDWVTSGGVQTFHLADVGRYLVQFNLLSLVSVSTVDPRKLTPPADEEERARLEDTPLVVEVRLSEGTAG